MTSTVALHPLVLLSIGDHSARSKAQNTPERRAGVLFGIQVGRDVEIVDTSPMNFEDMAATEMEVDHDDLQSCIQLHKAVYSNHEVLGWYAYGDTASLPEFSRKIQQEMEQYNESPLFLYFTISKVHSNSLPVAIYTFSQQDKKYGFTAVPFSISTEEAETLTVDYLSNQLVTGGANPLALHFRSLSKAVAIMASRIRLLLQYLQSEDSDDPEILRSVKNVCDSLPLADLSSLFQSAFIGEFSDSLLIAECASITRTTESVQRFLAKCRIAYDDGYEQRKRRAFI